MILVKIKTTKPVELICEGDETDITNKMRELNLCGENQTYSDVKDMFENAPLVLADSCEYYGIYENEIIMTYRFQSTLDYIKKRMTSSHRLKNDGFPDRGLVI
jgi:hypothetical protein